MMKLPTVKLTPEQSEGLPYPIGCPVWYNFPEKTSSGEKAKEQHLLKRGVVESVCFNMGEKDLIYQVVYNDGDTKEKKIVDEVSENKLAYGATCPVTVECDDGDGDGSTVEGTVLLCEPSPDDPGKILYTVMMTTGGFNARYECGIDPKRVKYRKVADAPDVVPIEKAEPAGTDLKKEQPHAGSGKVPAPKSAPEPGEVEVPSSITCDSVAKGSKPSTVETGAASSKKRAQATVFAPPSTAASEKKQRLETVPPDHCVKQKVPDSHRSVTNGDGSVAHSKGVANRAQTVALPTGFLRMVIKLPLWLQKKPINQRGLYSQLIRPKNPRMRGLDIGRGPNCQISVNYDDRLSAHVLQPPITITVDGSKRTYQKDHDNALKTIQELLLDHPVLCHEDGAKGRLVYELYARCQGPNKAFRPGKSTSRAVQVRNPFGDRFCFMSVVDLPFEVYNEKREFHVSYLLNPYIQDRIRKINCTVKVCGDGRDYDTLTKYCDPYVLVIGKQNYRDVDNAVAILKGVIREHMDKCRCALK